jgi:AcrR family transcriptional regulator
MPYRFDRSATTAHNGPIWLPKAPIDSAGFSMTKAVSDARKSEKNNIDEKRVDLRFRQGGRRNNSDRSAEMRTRIIEAAVDLLYREGYRATSMLAIAAHTGVTRGAVLHHFPNLNELMLAVADSVYEGQHRIAQERLWSLDVTPKERFLSIIDMEWDTSQQPATLAVLKILVESRNDAELAARFPPIQLRSESRFRALYWEIAQAAGILDEDAIRSMFQLHICVMRGMAMTVMGGADIERSRPGFEMLRRFHIDLFNQLTSAAAAITP